MSHPERSEGSIVNWTRMIISRNKKMNNLSIAIIIPVKEFNNNLKKCLEKCLELDYPDYEVIVFPDELSRQFDEFKEKIRVIPTGSMGPADKRDMALRHSMAEIFAFLDDDAYPQGDWLKKALVHFDNARVAAVGGPGVTPRDSSLPAHASGHVYSSVLASGRYVYRYVPGKKIMEVDDYPSCNFIIRRDIFEELGGFDNKFWPGEDTKLCLDITKKLGRKIIYDPEVVVHHYRRDLGVRHFAQVANYALHRGYFAKRYPENSRKAAYFMPSLFVGLLLSGAVSSLVFPALRALYLGCVLLYFLIIAANVIWGLLIDEKISFSKKILLVVPVMIGIVFTHICYGIFFAKGLLISKLKEE